MTADPGSPHGTTARGRPLVPDGLRRLVQGRRPDDVDPGAPYAVSGDDWLRRLPRLLDDLLEQWQLVVDHAGGPVRHGMAAVAVPVRPADGDGEPAVLKVTWPHAEAATEHVALGAWAGTGAVRLLRSDPRSFALLLERLDATTDLTREPIDEACEVIGSLLTRLRVPATQRVPSLADAMAREAAKPDPPHDAVPRRFVDQARRLREELTADGRDHGWLLHTDLHYENVLAARRQPWLAIDPHPLRGDPAFEVAPALWNRYGELGAGAGMRWSLRRRIEVVCEAAGIDPERARAWSIVRELDNARWAAQEGDGDELTRHIALLKALND